MSKKYSTFPDMYEPYKNRYKSIEDVSSYENTYEEMIHTAEQNLESANMKYKEARMFKRIFFLSLFTFWVFILGPGFLATNENMITGSIFWISFLVSLVGVITWIFDTSDNIKIGPYPGNFWYGDLKRFQEIKSLENFKEVLLEKQKEDAFNKTNHKGGFKKLL